MAPDSSDNDGVDLDLDCSYSQAKYQNSSAFGKKGSVEVEASGSVHGQLSSGIAVTIKEPLPLQLKNNHNYLCSYPSLYTNRTYLLKLSVRLY